MGLFDGIVDFFRDAGRSIDKERSRVGNRIDRERKRMWAKIGLGIKEDIADPKAPKLTDADTISESMAFMSEQQKQAKKRGGRQGTILGGGLPVGSLNGTKSKSILGSQMAAVAPANQMQNVKPTSEKMRDEQTRTSLRNEWLTWEQSYRELGRFFRPRMPKFLGDIPDRGDRRDRAIVNNWGGFAVRTLSSGMMAGITSPSRPWFKLTTPDSNTELSKAASEWLTDTEERMRAVFLKSNLYQQLPKLYTSLGVFGTGAMYEEEDEETVVRFKTMAPGSFYIGTDARDQVKTYARDFQMTVRQIQDRFDEENFSEAVKSAIKSNNMNTWIDVVHIVEPNRGFDDSKIPAKFKKFRSVYYEKGQSLHDDKFLEVSGYDTFPFMCPRWMTDGDDVYGTGPGWDAIGDTIELQTLTKQKAKANELKIRPPMVGDPSLRGRKKSMVPGGFTYVKFDGRNAGMKQLFDVNWDTNGTQEDIQQIQHRISRAFYEDLFLMLANSDRRQITATEIQERQQEKLLALGPVLETLNDELLDPIIDRTFAIMMRRGLFMEAPEELQDTDLKVEYISIMAQAQKQVGIRSIEMALQFTEAAMAIKPDVVDVANIDMMARKYFDKVGLDPSESNTTEEVEEIRAARAQQQMAAQQAEQAAMQAQTAQTLSQTDTQNPNALTDLIAIENEEALI